MISLYIKHDFNIPQSKEASWTCYPAAGAGIGVSPAPHTELNILHLDKLDHLRHVLGAPGNNHHVWAVQTLAVVNLQVKIESRDVQ